MRQSPWWRAGLAAAALAVFGLWPIERPALTINAPQDQAHTLPVYAQFTVTQSLQFASPVRLAKLVVPMAVPQADLPLLIRLIHAHEVVQEWRLPGTAAGHGDVTVELPHPVRLQGEVQIAFDGTRLGAEAQEYAPRLFFESDDTAYPGGHYRVAQNLKAGDIALRLVEEVPRGRVWFWDYYWCGFGQFRFKLRNIPSAIPLNKASHACLD
jgi:hypothetical protein